MDGPWSGKVKSQNSLNLSEFCRRRTGAPPPSRGCVMSLSWALRNGVARAHHLGRACAPATETSILRKGGREHAILRARARDQRWVGLFFGFLSILLDSLVLFSFHWALPLFGPKWRNTPKSAHFLSSYSMEMRERWWRIDTRTGSNQFFHRSHQLPIAITFDPELRLMHGLRLREALLVESKDYEQLYLDTRWRDQGSRVYIELGIQVYEGSRQGLKLGLRQQRTIGGSNCLWDLCFHVRYWLTSWLTVAAGGPPANIVYDRGRMIGPRGSATDGSPALVLDRSGLATTTDRDVHTSVEQVNYVGNQPRNDPYSNTYNQGWRSHPNFSWGGNQSNNNRPYQPPYQRQQQYQPLTSVPQ
ncbi:hypothetical protein PIB30_057325 [Stylosanthes scabra]|uniref:Uncharacterized protein n=1 Tax=Stylosanthes scabra TaxID=79078 RepID=A0ABU6RJM4_9FABA|nr:hypothetical protein [Stylosanthes scabra]